MKNRIRITIISSLIMLVSILNLFIPSRSFSELENRYLQTLPTLTFKDFLSGSYTSDFEKYATDQFPFRDLWVKVKSSSDLLLLKKDNGRVYFGKNNFLFDVKTEIDYSQLEQNIGYINQFIENMKVDGEKNINLLLIPSKETIYKDYLPDYAPIIDEIGLMEEVTISINSNIIDRLATLEGKREEYIYYKTDHHWTSLGAYYGYEALGDYLGFKPVEIEQFNKDLVSDTFLGSMYRKVNVFKGSPDRIFKYYLDGDSIDHLIVNEESIRDSLYDESFLDKNDKYSYFLGGDYGLVEINTKINNGRSLLLIKDSFSNSMVPFLAEHFETIYMIDARYFGRSITEFIEEKDIEDILMAYSLSTIIGSKSLNILTN